MEISLSLLKIIGIFIADIGFGSFIGFLLSAILFFGSDKVLKNMSIIGAIIGFIVFCVNNGLIVLIP